MAGKDLLTVVDRYIERSLVIVKPDGVRRGLVGEILKRIERTGLKLVALKMTRANRDIAEKHYSYEDIALRHGEAVRNQLLTYITEGPVTIAVFEGIACVKVIRKLCGDTEPAKSPPGTIRGDFCHHDYAFCNEMMRSVQNLIHASASSKEADAEIKLWFDESELLHYGRADDKEHLLV